MKAREELFESINIIIAKHNYSKKLITSLGDKFAERGLPSSTPNSIFQKSSPLEGLTQMELGLFTFELSKSEYLEDDLKANIKISDYFSPQEIDMIKNFKMEKEVLKKLVFNKIDEVENSGYQWLCTWWSFEDMYDAHLANLISYNINTQREATYKRTKTGEILILPTINPRSVRAISKLVYEGKFKVPNMLIMNVRSIAGKTPNIDFKGENRKMVITPEYDYVKDSTTFADLVDGQHRFSGIISAVEKARKEGKTIKGGLFVLVMYATEEEANDLIAREANRNDMSTEHTKALEGNDYNKAINFINEHANKENNILYNQIARTYNELEGTDKLTTNEFMTYAIKQTDLEISNSFKMKLEMPKVIETMNNIYQYLVSYKFDNKIEKMKNESELFETGMFTGYFVLAAKIKDMDYMKDIDKIADMLIKSNKKLIEFNLDTKNPKLNKLCELINDIVKKF